MSERTRQIYEWADGAAFNDGGLPRLWFHGTNIKDPFNIFTRWEDFSFGFHFGSAEAANSRALNIYNEILGEDFDGVLIPVLCRAENPLRIPDLYTWEQHRTAGALLEAGVLTEEEAEFLDDSASAEMIFAFLEEAGYDCLVYGNLCEHKEMVTDSIIVWRPELLKSPFAAGFERADPRLLPQLPTDAKDLDDWRRMAATIEVEKAAIREFRISPPARLPTAG